MTPLKTDTCKVNSLKFRSVRLEDSLSDTHPLIQKKKKEKTQPLIKHQAAYPQKREKKRQTLKPKLYFPIKIQTQTCDSSLHLHIHIDRTSMRQWKPLFVLCNNEDWKSLFVLCNNKRFRSYPISALQQQTIQKVGILPPFLVFY